MNKTYYTLSISNKVYTLHYIFYSTSLMSHKTTVENKDIKIKYPICTHLTHKQCFETVIPHIIMSITSIGTIG